MEDIVKKKTIAVLGATGNQGGCLVRALLKDGSYNIRALTRKLDSEQAKKLAQLNVELVAADLDDVESLTNAFKGCYGVFGLTNFWEHFSAVKEVQQAKNIATACASSGIEHCIWSTLQDSRPSLIGKAPALQGDYIVPHLDGKSDANAFFKDLGVPTTYFHTCFFMSNFELFGLAPKKGEDGKYPMYTNMRDVKMPVVDVEDLATACVKIFKEPAYISQSVYLGGDQLSWPEIAKIISEVFGIESYMIDLTDEQFRQAGYPGAEEMSNMFQFFREDKIFQERHDPINSVSLVPNQKKLRQYFDEIKADETRRAKINL